MNTLSSVSDHLRTGAPNATRVCQITGLKTLLESTRYQASPVPPPKLDCTSPVSPTGWSVSKKYWPSTLLVSRPAASSA